MIDLKGKTALVTGGSRGIGKEIVLALVNAGAKVAFTSRSLESGKPVEEEVKALGGEAFAIAGDVKDFDSCAANVAEAIEKLGKLDFLINNAGITQDGLFMKMKKEQWDAVIDTNLTGIFNFCKAVMKPMMKARFGRIVNISSIVGYTGNPGQVNYSATKAGIIGFSKSLAKEVAARNITCNVIAPGFIKTDMTEELGEAQTAALLKDIPMKRMGEPKDIANGVIYLCSDLADYVTGTTIHINGGMY